MSKGYKINKKANKVHSSAKSEQLENDPTKPSIMKSKSSMKSASVSPRTPSEINSPFDQLIVKIYGLWQSDLKLRYHAVKVSFVNRIIMSSVIKPFGIKDEVVKGRILSEGMMHYDPSDYENMCFFANNPLIVHIQPLSSESGPSVDSSIFTSESQLKKNAVVTLSTGKVPFEFDAAYEHDISCCNIDILPLFIESDITTLCVKKRMQPMVKKSALQQKSWDNLPLIMLSVSVTRKEENASHHRLLHKSNWMKVTVIGAYNLLTPYSSECLYTAATRMPSCDDVAPKTIFYDESSVSIFTEGVPPPTNSDPTNFYPMWEGNRMQGELFAKDDVKVNYYLNNVHNPEEIDLKHYLYDTTIQEYNVVWRSFHRFLVPGKSQDLLSEHLIHWKWPLEVHYYGDAVGGLSFMGFMDLFPFLHPGVKKLVLAVPLHWFSEDMMREKCNSSILLLPNEKQMLPSVRQDIASIQLPPASDASVTTIPLIGTGADTKTAFLLVEVEFGRPLYPEVFPEFITRSELSNMLSELAPLKGERTCHGRGQLSSDWIATMNTAVDKLRCVPYHGLTDICNFNRQLAETLTRVEIFTSFCLESAIFVNNNFLVPEYLKSKDTYEEMLLMAQVCLLKLTEDTLSKRDSSSIDPVLRAARQARQLNDVEHAIELYMQMAVKFPYCGDVWRELSTSLKCVNRDWANVCLNKAMNLCLRHPLTILAKGCLVFEDDPEAAEPFFMALLELFPFWKTAQIICIAYFTAREYFQLAKMINDYLAKTQRERLGWEPPLPRSWDRELGDFWEPALLLPGMDPYYDATDLLLRIRAIRMAEVCLGMALTNSGLSATYYYFLGLCCRLRGDIANALCHVQTGMEMFGQNTAFRCLEGECQHELGNIEESLEAFKKAKGGTCAHSILLSLPCWNLPDVRKVLIDLLRRQQSAYGWMALANDWLLHAELGEQNKDEEQSKGKKMPGARACAQACADLAIKLDRRAGRAWALLAKLVQPEQRREFCAYMALACGFPVVEEVEIRDLNRFSQESMCPQITVALKSCRCHLCEPIHF